VKSSASFLLLRFFLATLFPELGFPVLPIKQCSLAELRELNVLSPKMAFFFRSRGPHDEAGTLPSIRTSSSKGGSPLCTEGSSKNSRTYEKVRLFLVSNPRRWSPYAFLDSGTFFSSGAPFLNSLPLSRRVKQSLFLRRTPFFVNCSLSKRETFLLDRRRFCSHS